MNSFTCVGRSSEQAAGEGPESEDALPSGGAGKLGAGVLHQLSDTENSIVRGRGCPTANLPGVVA